MFYKNFLSGFTIPLNKTFNGKYRLASISEIKTHRIDLYIEILNPNVNVWGGFMTIQIDSIFVDVEVKHLRSVLLETHNTFYIISKYVCSLRHTFKISNYGFKKTF